MLPKTFEELKQVRKECRKMVLRRAIVSGVATLISVPGTDIAVDYIVLRDLLKAVNKRFGLNEAQIDKYDDWTKMLIFKMIKKGSGKVVGKVATKELIIQALKRIGKRLISETAPQIHTYSRSGCIVRYECCSHAMRWEFARGGLLGDRDKAAP